jgi:sec-independent protein translocase protein TatC
MTLLEELKIFLKNILHWIYAFTGFSLFFFIFGLEKVVIFSRNYFLPIPSENSFVVQIFKVIQTKFVPEGVRLIVTNPMSGFVVQLEITLILAFIATFPFFLYRIIKYISPALFEHERKVIFKVVSFSSVLFILGCAFAYFYMIPLTFKFMYPFTVALNVEPFFALDSFMSWIISIFVATGITFLLPVFMIALSFLGIITPSFWKNKWRSAFMFLLIFSAVITPDQTGITMILLFIPLFALYGIGIIITNRLKRYRTVD